MTEVYPWALIGGGMIAPAHLHAARACGRFAMAAACPSSRAGVAAAKGAEWGVPAEAVFADWRALLAAAPALGLRAVSIATPNALHAAQAVAALEAGLAVICDKPLAGTLAEAQAVAAAARATGRPLIVTYNYSAFPAVREARRLAAAGGLGRLTQASVEFLQDGRLGPQRERAWRGDPAMSGAGGTLSDLGTHALHLLEFVSGRRVAALACEVRRDAGGALDDGAMALLRMEDGVGAALHVGQALPGTRPGLRLRLWGTERGLDWRLAAPDALAVAGLREEASTPAALDGAAWAGMFADAFAALYADAALRIDGGESLAPGADDGVRGLRFVEAALASHGEWVRL